MKKFIHLPVILLLLAFACCSRTQSGRSTDGESVVPEASAPLDSEKIVEPDSAAMAAARQPAKAKGKPQVLEFSATWCGPCQRQKPIYEEAIKKYGDRIDMQSIDVDENRELTDRYHVESIPTFIFIDGYGKVVGRSSFLDAEQLDRALQTLLK